MNNRYLFDVVEWGGRFRVGAFRPGFHIIAHNELPYKPDKEGEMMLAVEAEPGIVVLHAILGVTLARLMARMKVPNDGPRTNDQLLDHWTDQLVDPATYAKRERYSVKALADFCRWYFEQKGYKVDTFPQGRRLLIGTPSNAMRN
jgi:hypothetical protein